MPNFQTEEPCDSQKQRPDSDRDGNVSNPDVSGSIEAGQLTGSGEGTGPVPWGVGHGRDVRSDHTDPGERGNNVSATLAAFQPLRNIKKMRSR